MQIKIGWDEIESDGQHCTRCGELITGAYFMPFVQVGEPDGAEYVQETKLCERCKAEVWPERENDVD